MIICILLNVLLYFILYFDGDYYFLFEVEEYYVMVILINIFIIIRCIIFGFDFFMYNNRY